MAKTENGIVTNNYKNITLWVKLVSTYFALHISLVLISISHPSCFYVRLQPVEQFYAAGRKAVNDLLLSCNWLLQAVPKFA